MIYRIWLSLACTPGSDTYRKLRDAFSSPEEIYRAEDEALRRVLTSSCRDLAALCDKTLERAEQILAFCEKHRVGLLSYDDDAFPASLREISNPPVLLYYRGTVPDFSHCFAVAVVGTRRLSAYGRQHAFSIGRDLARAGALVVSGMAIGIDGVALAGAVSCEVPTVAVIGSGIDICYPADHRRLAQQIVKQGCVMTEYAPGTPPSGENFPRRNRLISGLCAATVVIEGRERSGALITARCAREQGRVVYALPGNVGSRSSEVTNLLIRDGARLLTCADDIVRDFEAQCQGRLDPFRLAERDEVSMEEVLRALAVSCVTPSDPVFQPPRRPSGTRRKKAAEAAPPPSVPADSATAAPARQEPEPAPTMTMDADVLAVYKKIPRDKECPVESLVDGTHDLRLVMRCLLKLEIGRMVEMLPGEKVRRF